MTDSRLELRIGAPVEATDGLLGHVQQVILSPSMRRVSGLVVRILLQPLRDRIVPAELIAGVTGGHVALRVRRDEILRQPEFDPEHYLPVVAEEQGYLAGEALVPIQDGAADTLEGTTLAQLDMLEGHPVTLQRGQKAWATDGRAGRVALLLLDASGHVRHFVIRRGRLVGHDVIVPVDRISAIDRRGVWLAMERTELDSLPPYRSDSDIAEDVAQALWKEKSIRAVDIETIDVSVRDGVVTLRGHAAAPANKKRAGEAASQVRGVMQVVNRIVTDEEVVAAVGEAFVHEPGMRGQHIFFRVLHGIVRLAGEADNAAVRAAAEEVIASLPLVRGVINDIVAPGVSIDPQTQRVLQPGIGQLVYAVDMLIGRVEWVIISPRHRRVTTFVDRGRLPDPRRAGSGIPSEEVQREEQQVVIPIEVVRDVIEGVVLLTISGSDASRCLDFDRNHFIAPDADWQPPYPYTHADVLLDLGWAAVLSGDYRRAASGDALAAEPGPQGELAWQRISRGMPVLFRTGGAGEVDHVWLDPHQGNVGQIVVRAGGALPKDTVIPLDWVEHIDETGIHVDAGAEQLAALPGFAPLPGQQTEPAGREQNGMLLSIGANIRCYDGMAGRLKSVVIDPQDGAVTHLIVEQGKLLGRDILVPAGWIEWATEQEIFLNATLAELKALPEYDELDLIEPDVDYKPVSGYRAEETRFMRSPYEAAGSASSGGNAWVARFVRLGFHDDEVLLQRGTPVLDRDGQPVGTLDQLVVDPESQRVTYLMVRQGWLWKRKARIVPVERCSTLSEYGVWLDMTAEELDQAPLFRPPASDAQIAASLRRALETDPRTREAGLRVEVEGGVVRFIGSMTDAVRDAAREIARRIRGVIGFAEDVLAPPSPPLRIGEPVYARGGRYGTLHKVVVDPYVRRVTHLVVSQGGRLAEDRVIPRVVPIERVERAELDGVYLDTVAEELDQYPRYDEKVFVEPLVGWEALEPYDAGDTLFWGGPYIGVAPPFLPVVEYKVPVGVPEGETVLRRGADVFYDDQLAGSLDHVLFDPTSGSVTHLVVQDYESGRRVIVPSDWIHEVDEYAITLEHWEPNQPGVPAYEEERDDAEISADLSARLHTLPALSRVQVERGVARLYGNVPTSDDKEAAEAIARSTPGVIDVEVDLAVDSMLVAQVLAELAADRRTASIPFEVLADHGVVALKGAVPSPEIKAAAEAIVRRVRGVVSVVNELEIRPEG